VSGFVGDEPSVTRPFDLATGMYTRAVAQRILTVGFDPSLQDFTTPQMVAGGLTAEKVLAGVAADHARIRALGYELDACFLDPDGTARPSLRDRLTSNPYDAVIIGAGVRTRPDAVAILEDLIQLIRDVAPRARIGFNGTADGGAEAIARVLPR
jgi:hypothetical protein